MALSSSKKVFFWLFTISFPFVLLLLVEIGLRIGNYNQDKQDLFIEMPEKPQFMATNPAFPGRYFPAFLPQVAPAPFLKEKTDNTFRVFVFGGSTTQGFPFNFNGSFSNRLEQKLLMETQGLNIEVINLGMTAVNSYVIWDLSRRVKDYEPDAIVIYAGHNEFYGSFGVGSTQFGAGKQVGLKRLTLRLKGSRLYQLFENMLAGENKNSENRTLMARVVSESDIPLGGEVYNAGIDQFKSNMSDVMDIFSEKGIPVYIGTVASNLKDQAPLGENEEALSSFEAAKEALISGDTESAIEGFKKAKELDEIRFRAPDEINDVIRELAMKYNAELVDIYSVSFDSSLSSIPDNSFFVDHLHPDWDGNQLIGELFFDRMKEVQLNDYYLPNNLSARPKLNNFEATFSDAPVVRLTSGYPFVKGLTPVQEQANFQRIIDGYLKRSYVDSVAASTWRMKRPIYLGLTDAVNYYFNRGDKTQISDHYISLGQWQIFNDKLLKKGIAETVTERSLDSNTALLLHFILNKEERKDSYFINTLSAVYLLNQDLDRAGFWLEKSEKLDPSSSEMLYNYARYHVLAGDTVMARTYYDRYVEVSGGN